MACTEHNQQYCLRCGPRDKPLPITEGLGVGKQPATGNKYGEGAWEHPDYSPSMEAI